MYHQQRPSPRRRPLSDPAAGDVITAADGQPTRSPETFLSVLRAHEPGDTVLLTVHGPGQPDRQVPITLTERPVVSER